MANQGAFLGTSGDGDIIFSQNVTSNGVTVTIDTQNYQSLSVQFNSPPSLYTCLAQSTNDQQDWYNQQFLDTQTYTIQDTVSNDGLYSVTVTGRYLRLNFTNLVGSVIVTIIGRNTSGPRGGDLLSTAMDKSSRTPLYVDLPVSLKQDAQGALVPSDAPAPFIWTSILASDILIIDTTGYESVIFHQQTAGIVTPTISNDGINWVATTGIISAAPTAIVAATNAAGVWVWPVLARYMKFTGPASAVTAVIYLRQAPLNINAMIANDPTNLTQINGSAVVTAGVAGTLAVGGNIAVGVAPTANPLLIGGIDTAGLTRRLLTSPLGQLISGWVNQANTYVPGAVFSSNFEQMNAVATVDLTTIEGFSSLDILSMILLELKVLTTQMHQLPEILNNSTQNGYGDEPAQIRGSLLADMYNYDS